MRRPDLAAGASGNTSNTNNTNNTNNSSRSAQTPAVDSPQQPSLAERERETSGLKPAPTMPETMERKLRHLREQLQTLRPTELALNELIHLMEYLHKQDLMRPLLLHHASSEIVPALCRELFEFVERLDQALSGPASRPQRASREPARNSLPLATLDMATVRTLCLGLSALANPGCPPPFPREKMAQALASLSSLNAKLMGQALELGGADAMECGTLLDIGNLVRRLVVAELLDPHHPSQQVTRSFCEQAYGAFHAWAEKKRKPDTPHDVGKSASFVEMLYDYGLAGVTDPEKAGMFVKVLGWLFGREALSRINQEREPVALSGLANLAKRLLEAGRFSPQDRKLDGMWARLTGAIMNLKSAEMIFKDGRPLYGYANLMRTMMDAGLPALWRAQSKDDKASEAERSSARKMLRQFAQTNVHIVGAMFDPAMANVRELHGLSSLMSFLKAADKEGKGAWDAQAGGPWPERSKLAQAAAMLVDGLPQASLAGLQSQKSVGALLSGLGYLWQEGLVGQQGKPLACLLNLVAAVPATGRWQARYMRNVAPLLGSLFCAGHIGLPQLWPVQDAWLGPQSRRWTRQSFLAFANRKGPLPEPAPEPLKLDETPQDEESAPPAPRALVGETRLAQKQQAASPPSITPAAPKLVTLSLRPMQGGGGARARARARRMGADWEAPLPFNLSGDLAPASARLDAGVSPLSAPSPLAPLVEHKEEKGKDDKLLSGVTVTTVSGSTTAMTLTSTTSSTRTTTTTAVSSPQAEKKKLQDPAAIRTEWFRLLTLLNADPSRLILQLARQHPECLQWKDEAGHDLLWHLVISGKAASLESLIATAKYQPSVSAELEAELIRCIVARGNSRAFFKALGVVRPYMSDEQRLRMQMAVLAPKPMQGPAPDLGTMANALWAKDSGPMLAIALQSVIHEGRPGPIEQLLKTDAPAGMSLNARLAALESVVKSGHADALEVLLRHRAFKDLVGGLCSANNSLLHVALESEASPTKEREPADEIVQRKKIFTRLLAEENLRLAACRPNLAGKDAMAIAMERKRVSCLAEMLTFNEFRVALENFWQGEESALCYAVTSRNADLLAVLLALPDLTRPMYLMPSAGQMPVEHALAQGSLAIADMLLSDKHAYAGLDADERPSLAALAASKQMWGLVPKLLAVPAFARQAGNPGPDNKTLLVHAIVQDRHDMLGLLLANASVRDSVFSVCAVDADIPLRYDGKLARMMADLITQSAKDAVMLAVEKGDPLLVDPLLALPTVAARLARDLPWKVELVSLAQANGHTDLSMRLKQF